MDGGGWGEEYSLSCHVTKTGVELDASIDKPSGFSDPEMKNCQQTAADYDA